MQEFQERHKEALSLEAGQRAFGEDPLGYEAARPAYPPEIASTLRELCPEAGATIFEIGPGTGLATRLLLELAPAKLDAIEADARLAAFLREKLSAEPALRVTNEGFEQWRSGETGYDLGAAATAFHWLAPASALAKVHALLRPGGWWAMWWNIFGDRNQPDAFGRAMQPLFATLPGGLPRNDAGRPPYALDAEARRADLAAAGFAQIERQRFDWRLLMSTKQVVALTATFAQVSQATPECRTRFLRQTAELAEHEFSGQVERQFSTVLYVARKP